MNLIIKDILNSKKIIFKPAGLLYFNAAVKLKDKLTEILSIKGELLSIKEQFKEALVCCTESLRLIPEDVFTWRSKGLLLEEFSEFDLALDCFNEILSINPKNLKAWLYKAYIFQE